MSEARSGLAQLFVLAVVPVLLSIGYFLLPLPDPTNHGFGRVEPALATVGYYVLFGAACAAVRVGLKHEYNDLPLVVAGGGGGKLKLGKHIHCQQGTPLANLWLTQLQALGIDRKTYADSTGTLSEIMA